MDFHQFYKMHCRSQQHLDLMRRMNVLNTEGTISPEEWEVAGESHLYMVYHCFKECIWRLLLERFDKM